MSPSIKPSVSGKKKDETWGPSIIFIHFPHIQCLIAEIRDTRYYQELLIINMKLHRKFYIWYEKKNERKITDVAVKI